MSPDSVSWPQWVKENIVLSVHKSSVTIKPKYSGRTESMQSELMPWLLASPAAMLHVSTMLDKWTRVCHGEQFLLPAGSQYRELIENYIRLYGKRDCRNIPVTYDAIVHTLQNNGQIFTHERHPIPGLSFVSYTKKNYRDISRAHCISKQPRT